SWWPKSLLAKAVTGAHIGVIGLIMGGEHIFPMIGIAHLPAWSCVLYIKIRRFSGEIELRYLIGETLMEPLSN
ncbi:hypothetical protein HID58_073841, partial [Brassica napus]